MITAAVSILLFAFLYFFIGPKNRFKYILLLKIVSISLLMIVSTLYVYKLTSYSFSSSFDFRFYQLFNRLKPNISDISALHNNSIALLMFSSVLFVFLFRGSKPVLLLGLPILYFLSVNSPKFTWYVFLRISPPNSNLFLSYFTEFNRLFSTALFFFYTLMPFFVLSYSITHTRIRSYRKDCITFAICLALLDIYVYITFFRGIFKCILFNQVDLLKFPYELPGTNTIDSLLPYSSLYITLTVLVIISVFHPFLEWKIFNRRELARNAQLMNQNMKMMLHSYKNAFLGIERLTDLTEEYARCGNQEKVLSCTEQLSKIAASNLTSISKAIEMLKNVNLKYSIVDITACIETAVYNASLSPKITIRRNYDPKAPLSLKLYGDFDYLQEVFLNLLSNAEYALKKKGGTDPVIKINILSESDICSIEIWDNGCGIERMQIKNIFKAYYSTKASGSNWGIGLNYAETIVKQHHGNITVQSEVNEYTSFQIVLPLHTIGGKKEK